MSSWEEVSTADRENRRELVLSGSLVSKRVDEAGLDPAVFTLTNLNFLEISKTNLTQLPEDLGNLINLTNLSLHGNKLNKVPDSIESLKKLKQLDLANNCLTDLPGGISELHEMHTLNCSGNSIELFPGVSKLEKLHVLDISHNKLNSLPEGLNYPPLELLSTIRAGGNELEDLPITVASLPQLKHLDISNNKLTEIPPELGECGKLKEFDFSGNKLKDRRLGKMMDQCSTKSVLDYLRNILEKERAKQASKGGKKDKKKKKGKSVAGDSDDVDVIQNMMQVLHFNEGVTVKVSTAVADVRPYIVCCIVRNLNFSKSLNTFKRFITLQTKLHDGICKKRQAATIATHDLSAVKAPLLYDARPPGDIKLVPLFKQKETTADKLVKKLHDDAEELRRQKKRSTISGVHQYLELLTGKALYPVLLDTQDTVISFPPITNCEVTKISKDSKDILIEVTSSLNLEICKTVMDQLLQMILETGVGQGEGQPCVQSEAAEAGDGDDLAMTSGQTLVIEQVKVTDSEGSLKVVYPSRTDLVSGGYSVNRNYE